jgi:chromosome segregation ATPase
MVMELAAVQDTERQVTNVLSSINGMDFADRQAIRVQVEDCLHAVVTLLQQGEDTAPAASEAVRSQRQQIADCRQHVHQCLPQLEQLRTEWADRYRQAIGDGKEAFEQLSDQMQQQKSPEAYRWKRNFAEVQEIVEQLGQLNGRLMDLSSQVERQHAQTQPPPEDTGPKLARQDRDPEMPANMS